MTTKEIYVDGGSAGNPGPSRIAIYSNDFDLRIIKAIGNGTNNRAEYLALIYALVYAKHVQEPIVIKSDSKVIVNQMVGNYKVKSTSIRPLYEKAISIINQCQDITIEWLRREENLAGHMLE